MECKKQTYFLAILCGIEVTLVVCSIIGNIFGTVLGLTGILFRIILLICSACCIPGAQWAAFYSIIALLYSLYSFDPVGLFLIGHGQSKTLLQNIMCIVVVAGLGIASYVGYLYKRTLQDSQFGEQDAGFNMNFGSNNNQQQRPQQFLVNSPNTGFYGSSNQQQYSHNNQQQKKNFAPFTGQGYSLS